MQGHIFGTNFAMPLFRGDPPELTSSDGVIPQEPVTVEWDRVYFFSLNEDPYAQKNAAPENRSIITAIVAEWSESFTSVPDAPMAMAFTFKQTYSIRK